MHATSTHSTLQALQNTLLAPGSKINVQRLRNYPILFIYLFLGLMLRQPWNCMQALPRHYLGRDTIPSSINRTYVQTALPAMISRKFKKAKHRSLVRRFLTMLEKVTAR